MEADFACEGEVTHERGRGRRGVQKEAREGEEAGSGRRVGGGGEKEGRER